MPPSQPASDAAELLVFELAGVRCGLGLDTVREVLAAVLITPLPAAPPVVEGIIDVRGEIAPVYDLRLRFGLPSRPLHPDERLVVAWTGERLVALRCDVAERIERVPASRIDTAEAVTRGARTLAGVARLPDGLALIHDLAAFLDDAERDALDDALAHFHHDDAP
jgi:purine-binding chemotaxis protein CheW